MESNNTLPTAEQFFKAKKDAFEDKVISHSDVIEWMKEYAVLFAKHHVKKALEAASKVDILYDLDYESGNKYYYQNYEGIENAYPEIEIK